MQVSIAEGMGLGGIGMQTSPDRNLQTNQSDLSERVRKSGRNPKELTLGLGNGEENFVFGG